MITNDISWSLGATQNKSPATSGPFIPIHLGGPSQLTTEGALSANRANPRPHPTRPLRTLALSASIASIASIPSIPSINLSRSIALCPLCLRLCALCVTLFPQLLTNFSFVVNKTNQATNQPKPLTQKLK